MKMLYQIFGSESSNDLDVMVFVNEIQKTNDNHEYIKILNRVIENDYFNVNFPNLIKKQVNCNLCIIENGIITQVFKGTPDEVNNSMFLTYKFHKQITDNNITRLVNRDVDLKILRTARVLLSFVSRTIYRNEVKIALSSDITTKFKVLRTIDINIIKDNEKIKKIGYIDVVKTLAFQLGQTLCLIDGIELYSKEDISLYHPKLKPYLMRENNINLDNLNIFLQKFLSIDETKLKYKYE